MALLYFSRYIPQEFLQFVFRLKAVDLLSVLNYQLRVARNYCLISERRIHGDNMFIIYQPGNRNIDIVISTGELSISQRVDNKLSISQRVDNKSR